MRKTISNSDRGFTLMEMIIAMALGTILVGIAARLFKDGMDATWVVTQRSQMQQDLRAAENMLTRDISLAGANLPSGGVLLPAGGTNKIGCDQAKCYVPSVSAGPTGIKLNPIAPAAPRLNWVIPGDLQGAKTNTLPGAVATDLITVVYGDGILTFKNYAFTRPGGAGVIIKFTPVVLVPAPVPALPVVGDPSVGLNVGDLVLFQTPDTVPPQAQVGLVTQIIANGDLSYNVQFDPGALDVLKFNQLNSPVSLTFDASTTATRLMVVTYYIDLLPDPSGNGGAGTPRLMRQVNALPPATVTENVVDMQFIYETYNSSGSPTKSADPTALVPAVSLNLIRKINLVHLTLRSPLAGTTGYQSMDVSTEVSARNLAFSNRYSF